LFLLFLESIAVKCEPDLELEALADQFFAAVNETKKYRKVLVAFLCQKYYFT